MDAPDWQHIFMPGTPMLEIVIRGSVMYLALFCMLRFIIRREAGALGITDVLLLVLLADAAQNAMADDYTSVTDGLILVATIVAWSYSLNWLSYRYPLFRRLVRPPRVLLVRDGRILRHALAGEKISEDELMGELRTHGIADIRKVSRAYIEADGMVSVITHDAAKQDPPSRDVF